MTRVQATRRFAAWSIVPCLLAFVPQAVAQDSFGGGARQAPRAPEASTAQPQARHSGIAADARPRSPSPEAQDFGVAATSQLRPSDQLGGPTPTSIPGGRVIATQQLAGALRNGQGKPLLLHAYGGMQHLPGAIAVVPAAQGGGFDDDIQRGFGEYLRQATGGDMSKMLVFYCGGPQCWGSYNASLRAIRMGYRNVHWYRGGLQAWQEAGLPVNDATAQAQGQAPPR